MAYGIFRKVTTLELFQHHFTKSGHGDGLLTRQLISTVRHPPLHYLTRSVRRTSGFVLARHPLETGGRFLLKCLKKELRMILRKVGFLLFLMLAASAALGSSETAFETFKGFEGKWAIRSGQKTLSIEMTYQVGSKGSIVTEQFGKELSVLKLI
jgi:hypothetical protein